MSASDFIDKKQDPETSFELSYQLSLPVILLIANNLERHHLSSIKCLKVVSECVALTCR